MASIHADITLVGGGIMSATLAMLLQQLDPHLHICMIEQLPEVALESSDALNNAGTGHAGYCELNYTPKDKQGNVQVQRALEINAAFETSMQFWSYLVSASQRIDPRQFINRIPHLSAVWGQKNIDFLQARYTQLKSHPQFASMEWTSDSQTLEDWMPLMMLGRQTDFKLAATRIAQGTDVNFGALTRILVRELQQSANFTLLTNTKVLDLNRLSQTKTVWETKVRNQNTGEKQWIESPFVFLGAGGIALPLLQKSGIKEAAGYGGFPVSGQWLICQKPELIQQHHAKVYSLAAVGAPPMSVPHLDTRIINGKTSLLFGPYAGFTTKFLQHGSRLDFMKSIRLNNVKSLLGAGRHNIDLTKYLIKEALQSHEHRMLSLRAFMPGARSEDWQLAHAGKRVQIIKRDRYQWGKLEFGTEIVSAEDGSLAALLGASPGASVSVKVMLDLLARCFPHRMQSSDWQNKLKTMIPSYGQSLIDNASLLTDIRRQTQDALQLTD